MDNSAAVAGIDSFCITDLSRTRVRSECRADEGVQGGGTLRSVLERVCRPGQNSSATCAATWDTKTRMLSRKSREWNWKKSLMT